MSFHADLDYCRAIRRTRGFVPLHAMIRHLIETPMPGQGFEARLLTLCAAMNHGADARQAMAAAAKSGDAEARLLGVWMASQGLAEVPWRTMPGDRTADLLARIEADPQRFLARNDQPYPAMAGPHHWGFDPGWIRARLARGAERFARFKASRRRDVAVLVGNGPSLRQTDLSLLDGEDVYVTNYAIEEPRLADLAKGVAVSNYFVAAQSEGLFGLFPRWRAFPAWLSHVLPDSPQTMWFHAQGGPLFFSDDPLAAVAWHSTVSYFWLQILFHAGYRKVLLIGFDNSYTQPAGVVEGTLLAQAEDDPNHFDPAYFRGKQWQAADPARMAQTYALARRHYEAAGREIVNCTIGGKLEIFRRGSLSDERVHGANR